MPDRVGAWMAALAAVAVLLPSRAAVPVVVTTLLVALLSRRAVRVAAEGLDVHCRLPEWADHGQVIQGRVELRSRARVVVPWAEVDVPSALALGRAEPHREALALRPGSTVTVALSLRCLQRGRHRIGPPTVRLGDPFGMAEHVVRTDQDAHVTVFPQVLPLSALALPAEFPFVEIPDSRSLVTDPTAVVGVRDYTAGDPLSSVHWTATARMQRLMVKEHERGESRDTIVCVDLSTGGYPRGQTQSAAELAITVAASVLQHTVVVQRLPAGLRCAVGTTAPGTGAADLNLPPRDDRTHLRRMLEVLAVARTGGDRPLTQVLAGIGTGMSTGTTLLVVTGRLDAALSAMLLQLRQSGAAVTVALTGPSADDTDLSAGHLWMPIYRVAAPADVHRFAA